MSCHVIVVPKTIGKARLNVSGMCQLTQASSDPIPTNGHFGDINTAHACSSPRQPAPPFLNHRLWPTGHTRFSSLSTCNVSCHWFRALFPLIAWSGWHLAVPDPHEPHWLNPNNFNAPPVPRLIVPSYHTTATASADFLVTWILSKYG